MAKRIGAAARVPEPVEGTELERGLVQQAEESYRHYGKYTIENRALPDFRDGFKPAHRRVVWAMHGLGLHRSNSGLMKASRVVGECFVAGTQVTMHDGSTKAIEDIAVGDKVQTRHSKSRSVSEAFDLGPRRTLAVTLADGKVNHCTPEQLHWCQLPDGTEGWVTTEDLTTGHKIAVL